MDKLNKLKDLCKASVTVNINEHKDCYLTVKQDLFEDASLPCKDEHLVELLNELDLSLHTYNEMVAREALIKIQFYPHTPVGFYVVYHYDLDLCIDNCLAIMDELMESNDD